MTDEMDKKVEEIGGGEKRAARLEAADHDVDGLKGGLQEIEDQKIEERSHGVVGDSTELVLDVEERKRR